MRFVERASATFHFFLRVFSVISLIVILSPPAVAQRRTANPIVVQVAAFKSRTSADQLASALRAKGLQATVVPGGDVDRVVVGPFPDDAAANNALASLKAQGYDGYIRKDLPLPGTPAPAATPPRPAPRAAPPTPAPTLPPAPATNPPTVITGVTNQPARSQPPPEPVAPPEPPAEPTPAAPPAVIQNEPPPAEPAVPPVVEPQQVTPVATPEPALPPAPEPAPTAPEPEPAPPEVPGLIRPSEAAVQPGQVAGGSRLRLIILEGGGAINNTRQRTAREPVVQVVDENDRPVAGVAITFALPSRGASGVFANGARSMTVLTNAQGTATATGFAPNAVAGDLSMQVTGSYQGQTLSATIAQTNVAAGAGISATTIGIIGAVAAGAAVGAVVALTGGDNSTPTPTRPSGTASVRTGGVTIGAPSP